jgi:hypothetical protein
MPLEANNQGVVTDQTENLVSAHLVVKVVSAVVTEAEVSVEDAAVWVEARVSRKSKGWQQIVTILFL